MRRLALVLGALVLLANVSVTSGAPAPTTVPPGDVYVRVLGIAQDGGLPHIGCYADHCAVARADPSRASDVASIALILKQHNRIYLFDATPDIQTQLDALSDVRARSGAVTTRVDRSPIDGVFLTHAHIGHYLGLAFFGFEALNTHKLPVWGTSRMATFLSNSGPWSQLVDKQNIELRVALSGSVTRLDDSVTVEPIGVPHRDEFSDTVGYLIRGPRRSLLYVPDTDRWETWSPSLLAVLKDVDIALLDATFYSTDELPGRDMSQIPHPLITTTMNLLQERVDSGTLTVRFIHLNHSNPALVPNGPERQLIERRGFAVAYSGEEFGL